MTRKWRLKVQVTTDARGAFTLSAAPAGAYGTTMPATTFVAHTSVGTTAIRRFLRPVCYQDMPADLLPAALVDANPLQMWRRWNGELGRQ